VKPPKVKERNLLRLFDSINKTHFGGMVCGGIGWRHMSISGKSGVTLAVCELTERFIRVNTVLQDVAIPVWFLRFVIYHEMLHLLLGPQQFTREGKSDPHSDRFTCLEMKHADYQRAIDYEEEALFKVVDRWRAWRRYSRKCPKT
tara:strand:- start:4373 stop:4807 length:435 start_codon:yes stop_codon:yes gene_type:complete